MPGIYDLFAVILSVLFEFILILKPRAVLQLFLFVGPNRRRRGDYGTDTQESAFDQ
jgi:hypothetical protein